MASDLGAPLTGRKQRKAAAAAAGAAKRRRSVPIARTSFGVIVVLVAAVALRIVLTDDPQGGRPVAEVPITSTLDRNTVAGENATITAGPEFAAGAEPPAAEPAPAEAAAVPAATAEETPPVGPFGTLPDLVEESEKGPLPRIAGNGDTPFNSYSRASITPATADGKKLIAIVMTGLGLNVQGTMDAVGRLPDAVSLAFAPYGKSLDRTVAAAQAEGHELFLQVPLEPFDYPDNDPGPDTLLTAQPPRDNLDRLFTVMGKLGGYVGLMNNMGARFTASAADFGPVMEELGARGLGYLDDGSSNRSIAAQLAGANHVPFAKADMTLDDNPARAPILAALGELETRATINGAAIGVASALPVSVQTITEWAAGLEARGFILVPASALMKQ